MFEFLPNLSSNQWHQKIFRFLLYISYILFTLSLFGVSLFKIKYRENLTNIIKIYIAVILIIRFNPFIKVNFDSHKRDDIIFDREISFSAGILLLLSMIMSKNLKKIFGAVEIPLDMF